MGAAYTLYRYRKQPMVSVEIVVDTQLAMPTIDLVVANHGRSAIVITELNAYVPIQEIIPNSPPLKPPTFKKRHFFFKVRRKMRTRGSRNDFCEMLAESYLSHGAAKADITRQRESIRIEPNEKAARSIRQQGLSPYLIKLDTPNLTTLVPSCKIANQRHEIWGSPVMVGWLGTDEHSLPIVMGPIL